MSIHDFAKGAMASSGRQLEQVLAGLKEEHADVKVGSIAMSARETVAHLTDCYLCSVDAAEGKEPKFGSYSGAGKSWTELQKELDESRAAAVDKILALPEDKIGDFSLNYVILHDAYHVGQLALVRIQTDPNWDAYSIYA
jgi:uncharacterized damage-inducible protein DinB